MVAKRDIRKLRCPRVEGKAVDRLQSGNPGVCRLAVGAPGVSQNRL